VRNLTGMNFSHDRSVPQRRMRQWQMAYEGAPAKCQSRNQRLPHLKVAHELPARPMEVPQMTWQLESRQRFVRSLWMTKSSISPGTRRSQRSRTWIPGVQNTVPAVVALNSKGRELDMRGSSLGARFAKKWRCERVEGRSLEVHFCC
jgi:hypothetical protein